MRTYKFYTWTCLYSVHVDMPSRCTRIHNGVKPTVSLRKVDVRYCFYRARVKKERHGIHIIEPHKHSKVMMGVHI